MQNNETFDNTKPSMQTSPSTKTRISSPPLPLSSSSPPLSPLSPSSFTSSTLFPISSPLFPPKEKDSKHARINCEVDEDMSNLKEDTIKLINDIPVDYFYPSPEQIIDPIIEREVLLRFDNRTSIISKGLDEVIKQCKSKRFSNQQYIQFANSLVFPEVQLIEQVNQRNIQVKEREKQLESKRREIELERKKESEERKKKEQNIRKAYQKFASNLEVFVDCITKRTNYAKAESLLNVLYKPGNDHFLTAKLLYSFENGDGIPNATSMEKTKERKDTKLQESEEDAVKKFLDQKEKEEQISEEIERLASSVNKLDEALPQKKIEIATPDITIVKRMVESKTDTDSKMDKLEKTLIFASKYKDQYLEKLKKKDKQAKLKQLLQMKMLQDRYELQKGKQKQLQIFGVETTVSDVREIDPWTELLIESYVQPTEQHLKNLIHQRRSNEGTKKIK